MTRQLTFIVAALGAAALLALAVPSPAGAQSFTIKDGETVTTQKIMNTDGDIGVIEKGGTLNTATTAIASSGNTVSIENKGTITTTTSFDSGISSIGADASIVNSGIISTTGSSANGIRCSGAAASIIHSGTISTTGSSARGISSTGTDASIISRGSISTIGSNGNGISSSGANASITHSGTISTTGENAHGINALGDNASINNTGTITVTGLHAVGARFDGAGSVLTNTGTITATGSATQAIRGSVLDQILNLGAGSQIIGTIDLQGGTDTVNITGNGPSTRVTFLNVENINLQPGVAGVVSGNTVTTVDTTGFSSPAVAQSAVSTGIHNTINGRLHAARDGGVLVAAAEPEVLSDADEPYVIFDRTLRAWAEVFGGRLTRGGEGDIQSYRQNYRGVVSGVEREFDTGRYGLTLGYADSKLKTDTGSVRTDVTSVYGGLYGQTGLGGGLTLATNLILGVENYAASRSVTDNLNGLETATADFVGVFISPSISLYDDWSITKRLRFRPSGSMVYTASFNEGYTEQGTTASNLSVARRTAQTLNARAGVAIADVVRKEHDIELRAGLEGRFSRQDDIRASLTGTSFRFAPGDDDSVTGGYVGLHAELEMARQWTMSGDIEHRRVSGDEKETSTRLRAMYVF